MTRSSEFRREIRHRKKQDAKLSWHTNVIRNNHEPVKAQASGRLTLKNLDEELDPSSDNLLALKCDAAKLPDPANHCYSDKTRYNAFSHLFIIFFNTFENLR